MASNELSLDNLAALRKRLASVVGDEMAMDWIRQRYARHASFGLPAKKGADGKNYYTNYGKLRNLDVQPEKFLPGNKVEVVPLEEWQKQGNTGVGGTYSILGGVRIPSFSSRFIPEQVLVHEMEHERSGGYRAGDDELGKKLYASIEADKGMFSSAFTGRENTEEVLAELRDYQSRMPAWHRLQGTDWFKSLPNEVKAFIMRRFNPVPAGLDAMTGASPSE